MGGHHGVKAPQSQVPEEGGDQLFTGVETIRAISPAIDEHGRLVGQLEKRCTALTNVDVMDARLIR